MDTIKSSFSDKEKNNALDDLRLVGKNKPIGYLPISTIRDIYGIKISNMQKELESKGLVVIILSYPEETSVSSGALYTFHQEALQNLLDANRSILENNN